MSSPSITKMVCAKIKFI